MSADPLNLVGILLPGEKIALSSHTNIIFKDGITIAVRHKNEIEYLCDLDEKTRQNAKIELGKLAAIQRA